MTVAEFLAWDSGDDRRHELVDGEPRAMAPASIVHGLLQNELGRRLGNHLLERGSPCQVIANPGVVPRLLAAHNFRIPDLAVTCGPVPPGQILPDPVLLVEILSPGNQSKTWENVRAYTSIPGVREILVLRSDRIAAEILRRGRGGEWPERTEDIADVLRLESVDFSVELVALYARAGLAT